MSTIKKIIIFFINIFNFFKDILAPKKCYSCNKEGTFLCEECFNKLNNFAPFCYICKKKSPNFKIHKKCLIENKILSGKNFNNKKIYLDNIIVMTHYKGDVIKKMITSFKFHGKKEVGEKLGKLLGNFVKNKKIINSLSTEGFRPLNIQDKSFLNNFIITPVPLHFFKKIKRGFNQSEILSKNIGQILNINYIKIVKRIKNTRQQSKTIKKQRLTNLDNAFKISKKQVDIIDNKIILLVDDVVTTGTTLNEIAKVLKQNGAKKVIGICLASN